MIERELDPEALQLLDHCLPPAHPVRPAPLEECVQLGRIERQEVPQYVHLAPGSRGRELAPANHPNAEALAGGEGFGNATEGVVVGQRNGGQTGSLCPLYHSLGGEAPIRGGRMHVQVDGFDRRVRPVHGAQRRYPISGAVQDG